MIFYSRESPDLELFEKQHHGTQKRNKSNKNNILQNVRFWRCDQKTKNQGYRLNESDLREAFFF